MSPEHIAAGKIWACLHIDAKRRKQRESIFLGLEAIGICVCELATSTAFYEKLGFVKKKETGRNCVMSVPGRFFFANPRLFLFQTDNAVASGTRRRFDLLDNPPGLDHLRFLADELDTLCGDLKAKGMIIEGPSVGEREGIKTARLRDPDGNHLLFIEQAEKK
jgi:catechol 2,3-dioxygenase-like lactoylglutathione lyase family enzyme